MKYKLPSFEITPEELYFSRRRFLNRFIAASGAALLVSSCRTEPRNVTNGIPQETFLSPDIEQPGEQDIQRIYPLAPPKHNNENEISLEQALSERRSVRSYSSGELTMEQISQLLWAGQGISEPIRGFRTAPSAGATFPLELYLVTGEVSGLEPGVYHYLPETHEIRLNTKGDKRENLYRACLRQPWVREAQVNLVFTAIYERTTRRYGERGIRYVHMEVGHASQNVYLQAETLGLATVVIGAFYDEEIREIIQMSADEIPLYVMPVGKK